MIALKGDKSLVPQLTQRGGHGAALNAEIVGQLLAVERDGKAGAAGGIPVIESESPYLSFAPVSCKIEQILIAI